MSAPIIAWRAWRVNDDGLLRGLFSDVAWPARARAEARCDSLDPHCRVWHEAPGPICSECPCGLYAVKARSSVARGVSVHVVGQVALWGRIVEHELGYRAQYAYPHSLHVVAPPGQDRVVAALRANYLVDVQPTAGALVA